jgi:hypothetical protein
MVLVCRAFHVAATTCVKLAVHLSPFPCLACRYSLLLASSPLRPPPPRRVTRCPASVEAGSGWVVSSVALVLAVAPHLGLHSHIFVLVPTSSLLFCACASEGPRRWAYSSWACAPPAWGTH